MGYNILKTEQFGLCIEDEGKALEFIDRATKMLAEEYVAHHFDLSKTKKDSIRKTEAKVFKEKNLKEKTKLFLLFLQTEVDSPFDVDVSLYDGSFFMIYDSVVHDVWNHEEIRVLAMLHAFAPYAKRGAFLGFVGEDLNIWSYVFDGEGSFEERSISIDWVGGDWIRLTRDAMATEEDWETVAEVTGHVPSEVESVKLYVSDVEYDVI